MIEIKGLVDEDFVNYHKCSMFIGFPHCDWKCGKEFCQNSPLALSPSKQIETKVLVERYLKNPLSQAIVIGGLEPFDSFEQLKELVDAFRLKTFDDIVVYTGYEPEEIADKLEKIWYYPNMYFKFGRFKPNHESHFDEVLGVELASDNQYGYQSEVGGLVKLNQDEEHIKKIETALAKKSGHCPCVFEESDDTLCPCKEFRESAKEGYCHCQLYYRMTNLH